jgi:hypothetical protein
MKSILLQQENKMMKWALLGVPDGGLLTVG